MPEQPFLGETFRLSQSSEPTGWYNLPHLLRVPLQGMKDGSGKGISLPCFSACEESDNGVNTPMEPHPHPAALSPPPSVNSTFSFAIPAKWLLSICSSLNPNASQPGLGNTAVKTWGGKTCLRKQSHGGMLSCEDFRGGLFGIYSDRKLTAVRRPSRT